jgi:energy-coupling factor transport system permease protein
MLFLIAKIPARKVFARYKFMLFLIALVVALQTVFGGGIITGMMIACRIISLCLILPLLTMTTETGDIAFGITRLGLNYKTAYIITSAFNIIPSFQEDARQLIDARELRGIQSGKRNLFSRFGEYAKIALPLMIKAMRRASAAGLAMDSRAFGAYRTRTWPRETRMSAADFAALALGLVFAAASVTINKII